MKMLTRLVVCGALFFSCSSVWAEDEHTDQLEDPFVFTLYFENDGTFAKANDPQDRHYTNGVKITFAHQPQWAKNLGAILPFSPASDGETLKTAGGYAAGQNIYTPDNIEIPTLQPNDRPYAGWLYGGIYLQRATDTVFDHFEIDIGILGPSSLAEDTQIEVHDNFDQPEPLGWDQQLRDEPGINFIYQRKWKIPLLTQDGQTAVELIPQAGFTLGTINRHANIGALVRIGVNLPDDFGPGRIEEPVAATAQKRTTPAGYLFVRAGGKAVEHNTFLEGNNYKSSHGVDGESLLGEVQFGFVVLLGRIEFSYSQTYFTREFKGQNDKDSLGALTLSWAGEF